MGKKSSSKKHAKSHSKTKASSNANNTVSGGGGGGISKQKRKRSPRRVISGQSAIGLLHKYGVSNPTRPLLDELDKMSQELIAEMVGKAGIYALPRRTILVRDVDLALLSMGFTIIGS